MPRFIKLSLFVILASTALFGSAQAQIDPAASWAIVPPGGAALLVVPDGAGPSLASMGTFIDIYVQDVTGAPVTTLTYRDFEIESFNPPTLSDGVAPAVPTHDLTAAGFTSFLTGSYRFEGAIFAGGHALSGTIVKVRGMVMTGRPIPMGLKLNSPDLDGTGTVNLGDVVIFASVYYGAYDPRADFTHDGVMNLADIVVLATHIGASFPAGYGIDPVD